MDLYKKAIDDEAMEVRAMPYSLSLFVAISGESHIAPFLPYCAIERRHCAKGRGDFVLFHSLLWERS